MKIAPLPASPSSSSQPISSGGSDNPTAETKPEDDSVFTWRKLLARLDIFERCIIAAMIAGLVVEVMALVLWPFRRAPGMSVKALRNAILGGFWCPVFMYLVLIFYMRWKHELAGLPEVKLTTVSSASASDDLV